MEYGVPELTPEPDDIVLYKHGYSGSYANGQVLSGHTRDVSRSSGRTYAVSVSLRLGASQAVKIGSRTIIL
jgi:hypothetical protein